jgi:hypothetical protein
MLLLEPKLRERRLMTLQTMHIRLLLLLAVLAISGQAMLLKEPPLKQRSVCKDFFTWKKWGIRMYTEPNCDDIKVNRVHSVSTECRGVPKGIKSFHMVARGDCKIEVWRRKGCKGPILASTQAGRKEGLGTNLFFHAFGADISRWIDEPDLEEERRPKSYKATCRKLPGDNI